MTIYIGNLSFQATEEDLKEIFTEYGNVSRITLPIDHETGKKRGFAFVEMEDEAKEDVAISELDGAEWLGRELRLNKAKPRENRSGSGGGGKFSRNRY
ncbi:RNA-binding protein [Neosynechococcus sphagnicola sy1]|uniref:RNA-binding protein n=1 Tax=Neosynechococcus sphagnicola sy1 TaxID=1497020 RepID=A0A098TJ17_9CYAN|nr:RNA-binding protein [Neosynechococcus sphagnicola]KGF72545.1 RNA-binding protein [Neosynechococcus sphagnicola sy1]